MRRCAWCEEGFEAGEDVLPVNGWPRPVAYHRECLIRQAAGSVGHQLKLCSCFGGDEDCEPATMTRREAARAAAELARLRFEEAG